LLFDRRLTVSELAEPHRHHDRELVAAENEQSALPRLTASPSESLM
jgi:hypothetical protein